MRSRLVIVLTSAALVACGDEAPSSPAAPEPAKQSGEAHNFDLERIARGFNRPTFVGAAPGDPEALWVLEQPGRVHRLVRGDARTVLDLGDRVRLGPEQGLLGLAFHPDFAANRRLYLHWSDPRGDTAVAEFRVEEDGTVAPEPLRHLLHVAQPEDNHNGGALAFGPDGRLHIGLGDGGGAFDPREAAQDPRSRLGKLLAADVDAARPRWEVVLTGLRNPWRFWFDQALGEVWVADVGQDRVEEVNRVALEPDEPPKNLGWSTYEGVRRVTGHELDTSGELVFPVAAYEHGDDGGCSITGGVVYGGTRLPGLNRRYVYGDFCSGNLWSLRPSPGGGAEDVRRERARVPQLTHIGVDADGELVLASAAGDVYRATAPSP